MNFQGTVVTAILVAAVGILGWFAFDQYQQKGNLQAYASQLEEENGGLRTRIVEVNGEKIELTSRLSVALTDKDDISKQLENKMLELAAMETIEVTPDTVFVAGVADTVYTAGSETVYEINQVTNNYTLAGTFATPSGTYSFSVAQKPFGLEIREVITPTGRREIYANVVGRDDLQISNVEFELASAGETKKQKSFGIGVGIIVSEDTFNWGAALRYKRISIIGTKDAMGASFELLRF